MGTKAKQFDLRDIVASYPDFPKPGILFRDINPVFKRNDALNHIADEFHRLYGKARVDAVAGIESRGFVIATALALKFGKGVVMDGNKITALVMESGKTFAGKTFMDATYEGDLVAVAGVSFTIGREGQAVYGEALNGVQIKKSTNHQIVKGVDPYVKPGDATSGLLFGIAPHDPPTLLGVGAMMAARTTTAMYSGAAKMSSHPASFSSSVYAQWSETRESAVPSSTKLHKRSTSARSRSAGAQRP